MTIDETMLPDQTISHFEGEPLDLWCAYPEDVLTEATADSCLSLLSEDERTRWRAFRFDRHRREYLTTHALVRIALSHYHPTAPEAWRFETNTHGKPRVHPDCGLRFNLSNTPDLVVCLIAQGAEVGVDVESCERAEEIIELAPAVFSPVERAQLDALHGSGKLGHALSLWTLKEAYMKATGMGLSLPFKQFSFLLGGTEGIRLEFDPLLDDQPVQRWRFCLMEHAHHRIALMVESTKVPELKLWEVKPLFPPSMKPELRREQWFPASA